MKPYHISFVTLDTTDVQLAEAIFHLTYVQLSCRLADVTQSLGCLFRFSPNMNGTGEQEFLLMREGGGVRVSQCNSTINQRSAYTNERISVFDIENNGSVSNFRINPVDMEIVGMNNFTMVTGCEIPVGEQHNNYGPVFSAVMLLLMSVE